MLTADDTPTIRNAIIKRLDPLPNLRVNDIKFHKAPDYIGVHVGITVGGLQVESDFELPPSFEIGHLHNEIDEIAEHCKRANRDFWLAGRPMTMARQAVAGSGLRGRWAIYG